MVDRIPIPVLEECIKTLQQGGVDREQIFLRVFLELYQDMLIPTKESSDIESYRRLEEVTRYSNKELKVSRESIETVRDPKVYATLDKLKSF